MAEIKEMIELDLCGDESEGDFRKLYLRADDIDDARGLVASVQLVLLEAPYIMEGKPSLVSLIWNVEEREGSWPRLTPKPKDEIEPKEALVCKAAEILRNRKNDDE